MTAAEFFAVYVIAVGCLAPAALCRRWATRAPRLAMCLWLALPVSWLIAAVLTGLAVAAPYAFRWSDRGRGLLRQALVGYPLPGMAEIIVGAGLVVAIAVALRAGVHVTSALARDRHDRRVHAALLEVAASPDDALRALVLNDSEPAAYCLPYGRHRIVISAGAVAALTPGQLQAVLAHERAHLHGRHHLAVAAFSALARAFPWVPLMAEAGTQLAVLAELAADDAAARSHDSADLAAALVILARARVGPAVLTAGGPAAIARVQRLLASPPSRPVRTVGLAAGTAAFLLPAAMTSLPLVMAACDFLARP